MSKKTPWIILVLFILIGTLFASGILFPDTPWLPRLPSGPGTIGWILKSAFFKADGTVENTDQLAYVTASGYLQNRDCSTEWFDTVWMGVDIQGRAKCGHRILPLAMIGKFTYIDGTVEVMKYGSAVWTPANLTDPLIPWDIVRTMMDGSGTIGFLDDLSYLRLDINTYVELKTGINTVWQSVAEAILVDGSLWWRILSSTGVNLGWWGMVAGIRWTGLGIQKVGNDYVFSIVDSQWSIIYEIKNEAVGGVPVSTMSVALSPSDRDGDWDYDLTDSLLLPWPPDPVIGRKIIHPKNGPLIETGATIGKVNLLSSSTWVRENIKKDIVYLDYRANTGGLDATTQMMVDGELIVAVPKNITECNNTLVGKIIEKSKNALAWSSNLINTPCSVWSGITSNLDKRNSTICAIEWRNYWLGLSGANKCQKPWLLAFADYTTGDNRMYYSSGSTIPPTYEKYVGISILDDGWFAGAKCDPGVVFGFHTPAWSNPNIIGPWYPDVGKTIYITNPSVPIGCTQLPWKDKFKYDAVWDRTPPAILPYGTIVWSGITFGLWKYAAYPLSLLTGWLPTSINWKTIVVRVRAADLIPTLPHPDQYLISINSGLFKWLWLYWYNAGSYNKLKFGKPGGESYIELNGGNACSGSLAALWTTPVDIAFSTNKLQIFDIGGNQLPWCTKIDGVDLSSPDQFIIGARNFNGNAQWWNVIYGVSIKN